MADRMRGLLEKVLAWWNKFTAKQKTIIISAGAGIVLTVAIIVVLLTRPKYTQLMTCESTKQASQVVELLEGEGITYSISDDGLQIKVLERQEAQAQLLLGANDIRSDAYSIDKVTEGGFGSTESDKKKKYQFYMENRLENQFLAMFPAIKTAKVELSITEDDGTLISSEEESFASVALELDPDEEFTTDNAAFLARAIATAIGNKTTNNIVIIDAAGNMLFSGDENYSMSGRATSQLNLKSQAENLVKNEVKRVFLGTNEFDNVEVASNLSLDFSTTESTEHRYSAPDGRDEGMLSRESIYSSEGTNTSGGPPGTDSNTENSTTYQFQNSADSSSSSSEQVRDYLPDEVITNRNIPAGMINYGESSVSVTAIDYNVIREEEAKGQGLLDGISWDEYKANNQGRTKIEVDQDLYSVVANATGIDTDRITIVAYSENVFFDREGFNISPTDAVQVILIIVILALLGFVVFRSMRGEKEEAPAEEELSVESLLQSVVPDENKEDIIFEDQSETRKLIDKFVDENPEAAASLLRNWLNEDWG